MWPSWSPWGSFFIQPTFTASHALSSWNLELSPIFGDGRAGQAAVAARDDIPPLQFTPSPTFGNNSALIFPTGQSKYEYIGNWSSVAIGLGK
jgi:hypothetical protein